MNEKEKELHRIVDVVISCCATKDKNGRCEISREDVLGKTRTENVVMTRCILVVQILRQGYSLTTIASLLGRTVQAVRHIIASDKIYNTISRAYRIASEEAKKMLLTGDG